MKSNYPSKSESLGTYVMCAKDKHIKESVIEKLKDCYRTLKFKHERIGKVIWCIFEEPEFIEKFSNNSDPLSSRGSIAITWEVSGRAFYIKRTFNKSLFKKERHGFKKNIPRRKRGKYQLGS